MHTLGQVLFEMADHVHSSKNLSSLIEKREPVHLYRPYCVEYDICPRFRFPPTYLGFLLNLHLSFFASNILILLRSTFGFGLLAKGTQIFHTSR